MKSTMSSELSEMSTCWGTRTRPWSPISRHFSKGMAAAAAELSTQSSMKLGCRSQS